MASKAVKVATGRVEALIAGAILVAVVVIFAKYYDRGAPPTNEKPAVKSTSSGKNGIP
jgi:hypothetical protein